MENNLNHPLRGKILDLLEEKGDPPPLPRILVSLEKKINDPDCDIYEIASLIESDPILAGKLLRLSNSVYFGGGREVLDTLPSMVLRVGLKMVLELAYASALPGLFRKSKAMDLHQFWKHSLGVAFLSQALGSKADLSEEARTMCFLSGLMHDLGILIFDYLIPDEYSRFLEETSDSSEFLGALEKKVFGIDHAELGGAFLERWWPTSPIVSRAVSEHHSFPLQGRVPEKLALVVAVANQLFNEQDIGNGIKGENKGEPLEKGNLERLKISPEKAIDLVEQVQANLQHMEDLL